MNSFSTPTLSDSLLWAEIKFYVLLLSKAFLSYLFASICHPRCFFFLRPPITLQHEASQAADWMVLLVPVIYFINGTVNRAVIWRAVMTNPDDHTDREKDSQTQRQTDKRRDKPVVDVARDAQCWVHTCPQLVWKKNCSIYQLSIHSSHAHTVRHWLYHRERVLIS